MKKTLLMDTQETKTSHDWYNSKEYVDLVITGTDGWDRNNYDYSFNKEKINKEEFERRLSLSLIETR